MFRLLRADTIPALMQERCASRNLAHQRILISVAILFPTLLGKLGSLARHLHSPYKAAERGKY